MLLLLLLLEVIAPLTSWECLCCSSTMHSEQTVAEVYIVGPWVCGVLHLRVRVKDPNFITSQVHLHFVLRITLEVWNVRHSSQHNMKTLYIQSALSIRSRTDDDASMEWLKTCWHGKRMTWFHTKGHLLVMTLENKTVNFPLLNSTNVYWKGLKANMKL